VTTYRSIIKPTLLTRILTELVINWTKETDSATKTLEQLLDYNREEIEARGRVAVLNKVEATIQCIERATNESGKQHQQQPQQGNLALFTGNQQEYQQENATNPGWPRKPGEQ